MEADINEHGHSLSLLFLNRTATKYTTAAGVQPDPKVGNPYQSPRWRFTSALFGSGASIRALVDRSGHVYAVCFAVCPIEPKTDTIRPYAEVGFLCDSKALGGVFRAIRLCRPGLAEVVENARDRWGDTPIVALVDERNSFALRGLRGSGTIVITYNHAEGPPDKQRVCQAIGEHRWQKARRKPRKARGRSPG